MERIPANPMEWAALAEKFDVRDKSIHQITFTNSASNIGARQFLTLRACWPKYKDPRDLAGRLTSWLDIDYLRSAKDHLLERQDWQSYLEAIADHLSHENSDDSFYSLGSFSLVRYYQLASHKRPNPSIHAAELSCLPKLDFSPIATRTRAAQSGVPSTPTPAGRGPNVNVDHLTSDMEDMSLGLESDSASEDGANEPLPFSPHSPLSGDIAKTYPLIEDEQIVNTALLLYLNALTIHCKTIKGDWTIHRHPFVVKTTEKTKVYEARVDGYLKRRADGEVMALVEVKPFIRYSDPSGDGQAVKMQETAQVAAWISQHPPKDLESMRAENSKARFVVHQTPRGH
ncbi:hypothetical protein F4680DRAFT_453092 [Xylaria scruposa]|nr:hypothetical protein F4680DRAFT_453092 [Xylaria scruposa]